MAKINNTKELIQELKLRMEEGNVNILEITENLPSVNPLLIEMIFANNSTEFSEGLDQILSFAKLKMQVSTKKEFSTYYITPNNRDTTIAIYRKIKPKCSIRYNFKTSEFYDFRFDKNISNGRKKIFKAEMRLVAEDYMERKKKNIKNIL